jgi:hypothetical protein
VVLGTVGAIPTADLLESVGDTKSWRNMFYFFELVVPAEIAGPTGNSFLFPLILNPTEYRLSEPFATEETETEGGGLTVEENGIVKRMLTIRGTFGFAPKRYAGTNFHLLKKPKNQSYKREFEVTPNIPLSGQRHFQFLQDKVLRTYADLKQDPATSRETKLFWHAPKDDEHWEVKPKQFVMSRRRTTYEYDIELLVVGPAEITRNNEFAEDKNWLDEVKDGIRAVRGAIDSVNAAIRDMQRIFGEIRSFVANIGAIINDALSIVSAATDFVNGVVDTIVAPIKLVTGTLDAIDRALDDISGLAAIPDTFLATFRSLGDGLDRLAAHPELFQTETDRRLEQIRAQELISTSTTATALRDASNAGGPTTLRAFGELGTSVMAGDELRARAERDIGRSLSEFRSAAEYEVRHTDTLPSLAAKFLGRADDWRVIAALNRLNPPYISDQGQPQTVRPGAKILMPSRQRAPDREAVPTVLGVPPEATAEDRFLGVDFAIEQVTPGKFDFIIDTEGGSVDFKAARGIRNMEQAVLTIVTVERGTDPLYRNFGRARVLGLGLAPLDRELVLYRYAASLTADPRISAVRNITLTPESTADTLATDIQVVLHGFSEPLRVAVV